MSKQVLITGATGTIGQHLALHTSKLNIRLDSRFECSSQLPAGATVIHLASVVGESKVKSNLHYARAVNVDGAVRLAKQVRDSAADRFIFVSTSHVYETSTEIRFLNETSPRLPRGHYALQKLLTEELVQEVFRAEPERLLIARVFSIIDRNQPFGTLGDSIHQLLNDANRELTCVDDERDFLTPTIVADLLNTLATQSSISGVLNICSGTATTVRGVAELILGPSQFEKVRNRLIGGYSAAPRIVGDSTKLSVALRVDTHSLFEQFCSEVRMS